MRGFARTVTDRATFAYLADVFIDASERGRGAGKFLLEAILNHPDLQNLRRWILATKDAHALYAQYRLRSFARSNNHHGEERSRYLRSPGT